MTSAAIIVLLLFFSLRSERIRTYLFRVLKKGYKKGRSKAKGYFGERRVDRMLRENLDPSTYFTYLDLYVPKTEEKHYSQVDHIVVSRYGIFVIETKNLTGEIYGKEESRRWYYADTQSAFQNPIFQNKGHLKALQSFLGLPADSFHSLVFMISGNRFRLPVPPTVYTRNFLEGIKKNQEPILGNIQVDTIRATLDELVRTTNKRVTARTHRNNIAKQNQATQGRKRTRKSTFSKTF